MHKRKSPQEKTISEADSEDELKTKSYIGPEF